MQHRALLRWLTACIFLIITTQSTVAQSLKDLFTNSETPLFYYGIDFTQARVIDDAAANATDIRDRQFPGINNTVVNESGKFDFRGAFHKNSIDHDLRFVQSRNKKMKVEGIKSTNVSDYNRLKEADIHKLVKDFDFGSANKAIGLLFIVEGMSKSAKAATVWVTFVDVKNKKVLHTERMEGKGSGFGFRNYWAAAIKDVLDQIEKKKYSEWKSKYSG